MNDFLMVLRVKFSVMFLPFRKKKKKSFSFLLHFFSVFVCQEEIWSLEEKKNSLDFKEKHFRFVIDFQLCLSFWRNVIYCRSWKFLFWFFFHFSPSSSVLSINKQFILTSICLGRHFHLFLSSCSTSLCSKIFLPILCAFHIALTSFFLSFFSSTHNFPMREQEMKITGNVNVNS